MTKVYFFYFTLAVAEKNGIYSNELCRKFRSQLNFFCFSLRFMIKNPHKELSKTTSNLCLFLLMHPSTI